MHSGQIVFSQLMQRLPLRRFHTCVRRYNAHQRVRRNPGTPEIRGEIRGRHTVFDLA